MQNFQIKLNQSYIDIDRKSINSQIIEGFFLNKMNTNPIIPKIKVKYNRVAT